MNARAGSLVVATLPHEGPGCARWDLVLGQAEETATALGGTVGEYQGVIDEGPWGEDPEVVWHRWEMTEK